jgi:hypothetical protein
MGEAARSVFSASIALLAGYAFIRVSYYRRFSAEHLKTDRFALHILGYSSVFYILGEVIAEFMIDWTPSWFESVQSGLWAAGALLLNQSPLLQQRIALLIEHRPLLPRLNAGIGTTHIRVIAKRHPPSMPGKAIAERPSRTISRLLSKIQSPTVANAATHSPEPGLC